MKDGSRASTAADETCVTVPERRLAHERSGW